MVIISLTDDQAQVLLEVTGMIGGNPTETRRGLLDGLPGSVANKLLDAGVTYPTDSTDDVRDIDPHRNQIYFINA